MGVVGVRMSAASFTACLALLAACASNGTSGSAADDKEQREPQTEPDRPDIGQGLAASSERQPPSPGSLEVTVSWLEAPAEARRPIARTACGLPTRAPVVVHTLGGVRDALVTLTPLAPQSDATADEPTGAPARLTVAGCRIEPRVSVAAPGAGAVSLSSLDEARQQLIIQPASYHDQADTAAAGRTDGTARPDQRAVDLPIAGAQSSLRFSRPGVFTVTVVGGERDPSYVVVPEPGPEKYRITDERGQARFSDLAPGQYRVRVWHPPVPGSDGQPAELAREVAVTSGQTAELTVTLWPATSAS